MKGEFNLFLRDNVIDEMFAGASAQGVKLPALSDDLRHSDSGMGPKIIAILIARLEDAAGRNPFANAKVSEFPQTAGELTAFCERANA